MSDDWDRLTSSLSTVIRAMSRLTRPPAHYAPRNSRRYRGPQPPGVLSPGHWSSTSARKVESIRTRISYLSDLDLSMYRGEQRRVRKHRMKSRRKRGWSPGR